MEFLNHSTVMQLLLGFLALSLLFWLPLTAYYMERVRQIFLGTDVSAPPEALPDPEETHGERVQIETHDGLILAGLLMKPRQPGEGALAPRDGRHPAIIFSHPVGAGGGSFAKYTCWLRDVGFAVLTFDHRGHGESDSIEGYTPRQWVTEYEVSDLLAAIDAASASPLIDPDRISLFGVSRGAGTAFIAASRCDKIRAVVSDSAFSTWHTMHERMRKWAAPTLGSQFIGRNVPWFVYMYLAMSTVLLSQITQRAQLVSVIKGLKAWHGRPMVFIHGERDSLISVNQSRMFQERFGEDDGLLVVKGARHNDSILSDPESYKSFVQEFLQRSLA